MRLALLLGLLPRIALSATTYEVGPGKAYLSVGAVPWESLAPGDTVLIHARAAPYAEKWVVNARGTESAPVTVRGVPDAGGALPVIEGSGATTRPALNYWNEERGVIKVGGSNVPADGTPAWVVIERLHVRGARPPARFTGRNGDAAYAQNAAAIYVEKGDHVTIRECELEGNGNGLFVAPAATDVRVERSDLHGNGNAGSAFEHNSYTEALGITFEGNRYGPLLADSGGRPLAQGNNLKDRSAGAVIRWNWIEGGNRALDLVDAEGSAALVADPSYAVTRVYGNVLLELDDGLNSQVVHFGGDSGTTADYRPELHFWSNTVFSARGGNTTLVRLSSPGQTARVWNNVVHATAGAGRLALVEGGGGIELGGNWLTAGWVASHGVTGPVTDAGGNRTGSDPRFADVARQDLGPAAGSPLLGAAAPVPAPLAAIPLDRQYLRHQATAPRGDSGAAVGAFAEGGGGITPGPGPTPSPGPGAGATAGGCGCSGGAAGEAILTLLALLAARARRAGRAWRAVAPLAVLAVVHAGCGAKAEPPYVPSCGGGACDAIPTGFAGGCATPAGGGPEDVTSPTTVIGTGTPASCTGEAVVAAVAQGGVITFDCGPAPVTIVLPRTARVVNTSARVVIDGGGKVTLSGGGRRRILYQDTCDPAQIWTTSHCQDQPTPTLTVQRLDFADGDATGETFDGGGGGAIFARGGRLKVVGCRFFGNRCDATGPDLGGGAVRALSQSQGLPVLVVGTTFGGAPGLGNVCSNGGALSSIGVSWTVVNSLFTHNLAIGRGANPARAGTPGGGSGGAIYNDGNAMALDVCGSRIADGQANEGGGAIFFVSNDRTGTVAIDRSLLLHNPSLGFETAGFPGLFVLARGPPVVTASTLMP